MFLWPEVEEPEERSYWICGNEGVIDVQRTDTWWNEKSRYRELKKKSLFLWDCEDRRKSWKLEELWMLLHSIYVQLIQKFTTFIEAHLYQQKHDFNIVFVDSFSFANSLNTVTKSWLSFENLRYKMWYLKHSRGPINARQLVEADLNNFSFPL